MPSKINLIPGLAVVFVIIALESLMLIMTGGQWLRSHDIMLLVGVALVTGILFWILTPGSTGEVSVKELGIKLGGGAGIGAGFMILVWWLTAPANHQTVLPLPAIIPRDFTIENLTPEIIRDVGEVRTVNNRRMIYADFFNEKEIGRISLKYLKPDSSPGFTSTIYKVSLSALAEEKQAPTLPEKAK